MSTVKFDLTTDVTAVAQAVRTSVEAGETTTVTGPYRAGVVYAVAQAVRDAGRTPLRLFVPGLEVGDVTTKVRAALQKDPSTVVVLDDVRGIPGRHLAELVALSAHPEVTAVWVDLDR
jgi:orotate phosphoribosyltransferase